MEAKGISRKRLSDEMGVSRAYVSRVLNAPPNLTLRTISAVSIALDVRLRVVLEAYAPPNTDSLAPKILDSR